jgi:hypothetical protein
VGIGIHKEYQDNGDANEQRDKAASGYKNDLYGF